LRRLETPNGPALVLPYARGGDLFGRVSQDPLPEPDVQRVIYHLLTVVAHLHRRGFWHRDIKLENILLMTEAFCPDIVLADFGCCRRFDSGARCSDEYCGSLYYYAPELVRRDPYTEKVDIWAIGITMFACITGTMPFDGGDRDAVLREILNGLPNLYNGDGLDRVGEKCKYVLDRLLAADPEARPSAQEALRFPWFAGIVEQEEMSVRGQLAAPQTLQMV
jgi:calcium/calmodulin-dependent protein kinase I